MKLELKEAETRLAELIKEAIKGEEVVITSDDGAAVKLVPAPKRTPRKAGSGKGWYVMSDDFDEPLEDFDAYMP